MGGPPTRGDSYIKVSIRVLRKRRKEKKEREDKRTCLTMSIASKVWVGDCEWVG